MIDKLSNSVLGYLLNKEVIRNDNIVKEYYKYGIEITISSIISLLLIFVIGAGTNCIFESIVFLVFFIPIRQYTGGYHANTYFKCNLSMCIIFSSVIIIYKNLYCNMQEYSCLAVSILCSIVYIIFCPVENLKKPICPQKRKSYKVLGAMLGICYGIIAAILTALKYKTGLLIMLTLLAVTVLVIAGVISKKGEECDKE